MLSQMFAVWCYPNWLIVSLFWTVPAVAARPAVGSGAPGPAADLMVGPWAILQLERMEITTKFSKFFEYIHLKSLKSKYVN